VFIDHNRRFNVTCFSFVRIVWRVISQERVVSDSCRKRICKSVGQVTGRQPAQDGPALGCDSKIPGSPALAQLLDQVLSVVHHDPPCQT
jgi:hypothetical protein